MNDVKYIKGQAWIAKDESTGKESLVQDQIMVVPGVDSVSCVIALVDDIWADLLSASGTYKTNDKGYFYWEYTQTLVDNPDLEITVNFECPKPKDGLFINPDTEEHHSDTATPDRNFSADSRENRNEAGTENGTKEKKDTVSDTGKSPESDFIKKRTGNDNDSFSSVHTFPENGWSGRYEFSAKREYSKKHL